MFKSMALALALALALVDELRANVFVIPTGWLSGVETREAQGVDASEPHESWSMLTGNKT